MKKSILSIVLFVLFTSCSNDSDDTVPSVAVLPQVKVANQVYFPYYEEYAHFYTLGYNASKQLKSAVSNNGLASYALQYENGNISKVSGFYDGQNFDVDFTYTSDGIISGVSRGGFELYVTYDPEVKTYTLKSNPETLARTEFKLNADGDMREIRGYYSSGYSIASRTFTYETNQKGPLFNANRVTLQLAIACPDNVIYSNVFAAYRPFIRYSSPSTIINLESELDSEGYVIESKKYGIGYANFTYTSI